tara:strand:+ start:229 stop:1125 length:897 start_codon:yes stop_codon:yes gene_type:complete
MEVVTIRTITDILEGRLSHGPLLPSYQTAKEVYGGVREKCGFKRSGGSWLTEPTANTKFSHTVTPTYGWAGLPNIVAFRLAQELGISEYVQALRQVNTCGNNSAECTKLCINLSGKGIFPAIQRARLARTIMMVQYPEAAMSLMHGSIDAAVKKHGASGFAFRPDVFTDIVWELGYPALMERHPDVQFYGYTKHWNRPQKPLPNYHLTYSADERISLEAIKDKVALGHNVAVVVNTKRGQPKPDTWRGMEAIDGDDPVRGDSRYKDPDGVIILLTAKGKATKKEHVHSKFVWNYWEES